MYENYTQPKDLIRKQSPRKENQHYQFYQDADHYKVVADNLPLSELKSNTSVNPGAPIFHLGRSRCAKAFSVTLTDKPSLTVEN